MAGPWSRPENRVQRGRVLCLTATTGLSVMIRGRVLPLSKRTGYSPTRPVFVITNWQPSVFSGNTRPYGINHAPGIYARYHYLMVTWGSLGPWSHLRTKRSFPLKIRLIFCLYRPLFCRADACHASQPDPLNRGAHENRGREQRFLFRISVRNYRWLAWQEMPGMR